MAFSLNRFTRTTLAFNSGSVTLEDASIVNGPSHFTYATAGDTAATVAAANYFNAESVIYDLEVDDIIACICSDSNQFLQVATVDTTASPKTITTVAFTAAGSVDTANLVDGAVTNAKVDAAAAIAFSKLEVMTSGNILVGSAANVAAEVTMSGDVAIIASGATTIQAGAVDSSMMNANMLRYASVTMSASEFNGAYAAPHLLVAAAGANTLIVPEKVQILMTYGLAAFAAGGVAACQWDSTANGAGVIATTTLAAATFQPTASTGWNMNAGVVAETFTTCVNKGIYFSNITGAFTTGDSDMVVHIWYKVIPTV
jgi:hypothetical protein